MMKRLTSAFLVLAILLALTPVNVFAGEADKLSFSDVNDTDYYAKAAEALKQLDILAGYPDGTFGAEKPITRAEVAAVVCRMIDRGVDAEAAIGETRFEDVAAGHWASGYINLASEAGIINGDGRGRFHPEKDVTYEEAVKMVVCGLGYGDFIVVDPRDWSKGYLDAADEMGISDDVRSTKGKASTRGDIAVMVYNGLSLDLVAPTASLRAGTYGITKSVTLETDTTGAEIYYTTDGSIPTIKSEKYTKAIFISKTCVLKAIAVKHGVIASDVLSVEYTIRRSSSSGASPSQPSPVVPTTYTVSFDLNYEGANGAPETQVITAGNIATEPAVPMNESCQFVGWFLNKDEKNLRNFYDFSAPVESDIVLFARWIDMTDTDGDGLVNGLEEIFGTDKMLADTDGDELNDYIEIFKFGSDPLLQDTDDNGIKDGDEDHDNDGLSSLEELNGTTDPADSDSDGDELLDGEEMELGTDPNKVDTDEDGVSDSKEIELGTDPLTAQSIFSMNVSADYNGEGVKASVQMDLLGEQVETLRVQSVEDDVFFPETIPGYMGKAYEFSVDGAFDRAIISFEFDLDSVGADFDPIIYYFNEETQEFEELETTINGNIASAEVTHFSKYILLNRIAFGRQFEWKDVWESGKNYTGVEIVLVIDDSGSMSWNDANNERLGVARDLIDKLPDNSKIGIVRFQSGAEQLTTQITEDKEYAKSFLTADYFLSSGGTDMYTGIDLAFSLFETTSEDIMKTIVVLSDGDAQDTQMHHSIVTKAENNDVRIHAVGLGTSSTLYFNQYLKPLATGTGGAFYLASDASQLAEIYKDISEKIDIETDSDNDGVPDYYEDGVIIFNGIRLKLDKNNPDTDGDGLLDGEELVITKKTYQDGTKVLVTGKLVLGDPTKFDTDGDGYDDNRDGDWRVPYRTPVILIHGRNDNTADCFGAKTVTADSNSHYGSSATNYTDAGSHQIKATKAGKLAKALEDAGYKQNYSLFAFNYPNQDTANVNAVKLKGYILDLVAMAKSGEGEKKRIVSAAGIFPTKDQDFYQFDLIGHSNGGLVSRFYIENLDGSAQVRKLITIDTPHYGSGFAFISHAIDLSQVVNILIDDANCFPMDADLAPSSTLYNGGQKKVFKSLSNPHKAEYMNIHQSPKLKGNLGLPTAYYAIGGYDVLGNYLIGDLAIGELALIPEHLRNTQFIFDFDLAVGTTSDFYQSIVKGYKTVDKNIRLSLEREPMGSEGDNVVNLHSQFGVKNRFGWIVEFVYFRKTSMIVDTVPGHNLANHFHGEAQNNRLTIDKVIEYLSEPLSKQA